MVKCLLILRKCEFWQKAYRLRDHQGFWSWKFPRCRWQCWCLRRMNEFELYLHWREDRAFELWRRHLGLEIARLEVDGLHSHEESRVKTFWTLKTSKLSSIFMWFPTAFLTRELPHFKVHPLHTPSIYLLPMCWRCLCRAKFLCSEFSNLIKASPLRRPVSLRTSETPPDGILSPLKKSAMSWSEHFQVGCLPAKLFNFTVASSRSFCGHFPARGFLGLGRTIPHPLVLYHRLASVVSNL